MSGLEKTLPTEPKSPAEDAASPSESNTHSSATLLPLPAAAAPKGEDDDDQDARPASQPNLTASAAVGTKGNSDKDMKDAKAAIRREGRNGHRTTTAAPGAVAVGPIEDTAVPPPTSGASSIKAAMREERRQTNSGTATEPPVILPGAFSVGPASTATLRGNQIRPSRRQQQQEAKDLQQSQVGAQPSTAKDDERVTAKGGRGLTTTSTGVRSSFLEGMSRIRPSRLRGKKASVQGTVVPGAEEGTGPRSKSDMAATPEEKHRDEEKDSDSSSGMDEMNLSKLVSARVTLMTPSEKNNLDGGMTPSERKNLDGGDRPSMRPIRPSDPAIGALTDDKVERDDNELASNPDNTDDTVYTGEGAMVTAQVIDEQELEAQYHERMLRDVVAADVVDADELKEKGRCWKISLAIVCIVAIVCAIAIPLSQDDQDPPTPSPTVQLPNDFLYDLFFPYSGSALDDPTTPQYRAFSWLLNDDPAQLTLNETNDTTLMERYAAAVFYYSTDGDNWIDKHMFLSNSSLCDWKALDQSTGFFCPEGSDSPSNLELVGNNLTGTLPGELRMFPKLRTISFIVTGLEGTLPSELGEMTSLTMLQLSGLLLSGTIPASYSKLNMRILNLIDNMFTGTFPSGWLSTLGDGLEIVAIAQNSFEGPLPELKRQSEITNFWAFDNLFEGPVPLSYCQQAKLQFLFLGNNVLTGSIPEQINALESLEAFQAQDNRLTGSLPGSISEVSAQEINLQNNRLNGTLPSILARMRSLTTLNLAGNQISGSLPSEFGDLEALGTLDLSANSLTGFVPSSFTQLSTLNVLDLSGTSITGLESVFCSQGNLTTILRGDCLGDSPTICTCCSTCCVDGEDCETVLPAVCAVRSTVYESYVERGTSCECVQNSTVLSCRDTCETCNIDGSVCVASTNYGTTFDEESGVPILFENTLQYTVGRDETLSYTHIPGADECELRVNGEKCEFCGFVQCSSSQLGYQVSCSNIGGPITSTCDNMVDSIGYLEVFYLADRGLASGCSLVLSDYSSVTDYVEA